MCLIDNISLVSTHKEIPNGFGIYAPVQVFGLRFNPKYGKYSGDLTCYESYYKNLKINLCIDSKLLIQNSLHKYYHSNNYSDYSYSDLIETIDSLSRLYNLSLKETRITHIEIGLNVNVTFNIHDFIKSICSYKTKSPLVMNKKGKQYGIKFVLEQYEVKLYDKSLEHYLHTGVKIPYNILRYEVVIKDMAKLSFIGTLEDVIIPSKISSMFGLMMDIYKKIETKRTPDLSLYKCRDREFFYAGQFPEFWSSEKSINANTYKKKKAEYRRRFENFEKSFDFEILRNALVDKFELLLSK